MTTATGSIPAATHCFRSLLHTGNDVKYLGEVMITKVRYRPIYSYTPLKLVRLWRNLATLSHAIVMVVRASASLSEIRLPPSRSSSSTMGVV